MAKTLRQQNYAFAGPTRAIPSGQDRPIFLARVANQNTVFASSCPLAEPAMSTIRGAYSAIYVVLKSGSKEKYKKSTARFKHVIIIILLSNRTC